MTSFKGYPRKNGTYGIRNDVVVLTTIGCANGAVVRVGELNPDAVTMLSVGGCGNSHSSRDYGHVVRDVCLHPNVYATVIIGLGCEPHNAVEMAKQVEGLGAKVFVRTIQTDGGSDKVVEECDKAVKQFLKEAKEVKPVDVPVDKLAIGLYFDDDDENNIEYNKSLGDVADWIVGQGGAAIVAQSRSFLGKEEKLADFAANKDVADKLKEIFINERFQMKKHFDTEDLSKYENKNAEKAMSVFGKCKIEHVLNSGSALRGKTGLVYQDGTNMATAAVSNTIAAGAQIAIATSGKISLLGFPMAPVLKVCTCGKAFSQAPMDADVDASKYSPEELSKLIIEKIEAIANGEQVVAEKEDHTGGFFETQFRLYEDLRPNEVEPCKFC